MSDLNILHAQNADLRSRVSNSGLACDAPTSANRKDIDAFELAMGENLIESDGSVIVLCSDEIYNKKYNISKQNLYKIIHVKKQ